MAGLDGLKYFDDGGYSGDSGDSGSSGTPMKQGPGGKLSPVNNVVLSSEEQGKILQRMQDMYNQRHNLLSPVANAFSAGKSYLTGNIVPWKQQQMAQEQQDITNLQQMAAMRAQSKMRDDMVAQIAKNESGGGAGGGVGGAGGGNLFGVNLDANNYGAVRDLIKDGYIDKARDLALNYAKQTGNADLRAESYSQMVPVYNTETGQRTTVPVIVARQNPQKYVMGDIDPNTMAMRFPQQGAAQQNAPVQGEGAQQNAPMSVRNNNPGNIVDPKTGEFMKYKTPEAGQAALMKDLDGKISGNSPAYKARFGDTPVTPAKLAEVWSPATAKGNSPESTKNYGAFIAKELGISPTETIPDTPEAKQKVAQAITKFEKGAYGETAPAAQVAGVPVDKTLAKGEEVVQPQAPQAQATKSPVANPKSTMTGYEPTPGILPDALQTGIAIPRPKPTGNSMVDAQNDKNWEQQNKDALELEKGRQADFIKADTDKANAYIGSLGSADDTFKDLAKYWDATKGKKDVFDLSGKDLKGKVAGMWVGEGKEGEASTNDKLSKILLSGDKRNWYAMSQKGAKTVSANWAKNLVQGAGGRLTNADLKLGDQVSGVGPDVPYETHATNLAQHMEQARTVYYRGDAFKKWKTEHPKGTVSDFEQTPYYQIGSRLDAARDVAKLVKGHPETNYIHSDTNGKDYVILKGKKYYL